jgi:hypothetical protein
VFLQYLDRGIFRLTDSFIKHGFDILSQSDREEDRRFQLELLMRVQNKNKFQRILKQFPDVAALLWDSTIQQFFETKRKWYPHIIYPSEIKEPSFIYILMINLTLIGLWAKPAVDSEDDDGSVNEEGRILVPDYIETVMRDDQPPLKRRPPSHRRARPISLVVDLDEDLDELSPMESQPPVAESDGTFPMDPISMNALSPVNPGNTPTATANNFFPSATANNVYPPTTANNVYPSATANPVFPAATTKMSPSQTDLTDAELESGTENGIVEEENATPQFLPLNVFLQYLHVHGFSDVDQLRDSQHLSTSYFNNST